MSQETTQVWPTKNLVACGTPTDRIAEPVYLRELDDPDGYVMSSAWFQAAGRISAARVAAYLTCGRWEWELRPVDEVPDSVPWRTAPEEYYRDQGQDQEPEEETTGQSTKQETLV